MNQFELSSREEINIYINSGLTPTELFILRLLLLAIDGDPSLLINYLSNVNNGKELFRQVLESLKEKKVILSSFKVPCEGEALNYSNIPFNKNFIKMYIKESNQLGKELFDAYPPFITINGKMCSIKNFTKAYNLYSLFWGLVMKIIPINDLEKIDDQALHKQDQKKAGLMVKFGELVKKAINCCIE